MFLEIENLRKSFGAEPVLRGVSAAVAERETLSILGRSGCGKTTLLKVVAGLERSDGGAIRLEGADVTDVRPQERGVVYLYQEPLLFPHLDVTENVAFGLRLRRTSGAEVKRRTGEMIESLGLSEHARKRPDQLSGGQRQRVAFGRAIIVSPRLLLLDEPFANLDAEIRADMQALFKRLAARYRITSLFVTHNLKEALLMGDRMAHLRGGTLTTYASREAFIQDPGAGVQAEIAFWESLEDVRPSRPPSDVRSWLDLRGAHDVRRRHRRERVPARHAGGPLRRARRSSDAVGRVDALPGPGRRTSGGDGRRTSGGDGRRTSGGTAGGRPAYVSFRHGAPHRLLPNQIPYRAQAWALREVGCGALLVTSSVGVLDPALPLYRPLLVGDLLTLDNRLPDGGACTVFTEPDPRHGHLVLNEGLFSRALTSQVEGLAQRVGERLEKDVVFGYVGGPRTKTPAENRMWKGLGAQVNSMTLAPEVILANELEIPCAAVVVGHKYSVPDVEAPEDRGAVAETLARSRAALGRIVRAFLAEGEAVPFGNHLFRFGEEGA